LEAKYGLSIWDNGLTSASLSHPIYFAHYQVIFGLTGTIGSSIECHEIEDPYSINSFDVPPHRNNLRKECESLVFSSQEGQYAAIIKDIQQMVEERRSVLILCETIQASMNLAQF